MGTTESRGLLAIDVGNSRTKLALFEFPPHQPPRSLPEPLRVVAVPHADEIPWSEIAGWTFAFSAGEDRVRGIVAGTNPQGVARVLAAWPGSGWPPPRIVSGPTLLPLQVAVDAPERVGIDRLLNAVAANVLRPQGAVAVIVDCGSATTVDLLSADGAFQGGAILAGFELASRSLHEYTALLPYIPMEDLQSPPMPLGRNTRDALRSGLYWGQVGGVRALVERLIESADVDRQDAAIYLTGGGAELLRPHFPAAAHVPHLTLQGLACVCGRL